MVSREHTAGAARPPLVFILGGARSGKSARALGLAANGPGPRAFIATAEPSDAEMAERIARHRQDRGGGWRTLEAPLDPAGALGTAEASGCGIAVIDCLTLWLSNLLLAGRDPEAEGTRLLQALAERSLPVIAVSNEVGLGLVPDTPLGRVFRDAQGRLNQRVAAAADVVEFVAAGLSLPLKGRPPG
ncbi:MAG: bifunctional adenosylcobinamide kinase/adenosylcobinamide-phosphate guanylyltransferase [Alphaproteobacteria bacterium]|nr:bifunctional adenosylcobinamide kinase/adenosylcobinamide-phosphate guanylyltransferase [Alphaproteobacteria bacterium]